MNKASEIDLLLIGKTGNGKSATGNSILRRKVFKSGASAESVTKSVDSEVGKVNGRVVKVVDSPGVGDTDRDKEKAFNLVLDGLKWAIITNPVGYHAFLLVLKYGSRFTEEEVQTVKFLKHVFGQSFVEDYCIIVMTNGDTFMDNHGASGKTFETWCEEQTGEFKELLKECQGRIVLFNNHERAEDQQVNQAQRLLDIVDQLRMQGRRYNDETFEKAFKTRTLLMVECKEPMIREETLEETSLLIQKLESLQAHRLKGERLKKLEDLLSEANALYTKVEAQDRGTGVLKDLLQTVESIKSQVSYEIDSCDEPVKKNELSTKMFKTISQTDTDMTSSSALNKEKLAIILGHYGESKKKFRSSLFPKLLKRVDWPFSMHFKSYNLDN